MASLQEQPSRLQIWIKAMRPRTLPLAIAGILMGSALAAVYQPFSWIVTLLCVLTALVLQILSNLANDYGDFQHGADSTRRQGPQRAVQSGAVTPKSMLTAITITAVLAAFLGLIMLWVAFGREAFDLMLLFIFLGALAILAAIAYTAGIRPYGYAGLGDLSVLIFFGWVAVIGSYFLNTQRFDGLILLPATSMGLLAVAVLNVNNIRDLDSDKIAGKNTIPVRLGPHAARIYHWILLTTAVLFAVIYVLLAYNSPWQFLFLLAIPLIAKNGLDVWRTADPQTLNPMLKQLSLTTLLFVSLFIAGQLI